MTKTNASSRELALQQGTLATFTQSIIASSPFATLVTDLQGRITSMNSRAEQMLGYREDELLGCKGAPAVLDPGSLGDWSPQLSRKLATLFGDGAANPMLNPLRGLVDEFETEIRKRDGSCLQVQVTVSAMTGPEGDVLGLIVMAYDVTERKRNDIYLSHLAKHDALTGLPTRALLCEELATRLREMAVGGSKFALLLLDLDHLKRVNEMLGQSAGDEVLLETASRLRRSVREGDAVARLGGDEFAILLAGIENAAEAKDVATKVLAHLAEPLRIDGHVLRPTASIGICMCTKRGCTSEQMLQSASGAMYRVKLEGRNGYRVFTDEMAVASLRKRRLEQGLHQALHLGELELVYQPQVSLRTGAVTGVEALLRWRSGKLGMVMPNDFIPLAEESGLIVPIGEWVLRTACRQGRQLQLETGRDLTIAVNISPRQFEQDGLPSLIAEILCESGLPAASLELEITENILIEDTPKAISILEQLRAMGIRVALDDFGTGFSSMSYLMRFRVDRLKIDQSFIRNMATNADSRAVTSAVLALASGLNIAGIAEGVETVAHRDLLISKGCEEAQGFLYSKPVPPSFLPEVIYGLEQSETFRYRKPVRGVPGVEAQRYVS